MRILPALEAHGYLRRSCGIPLAMGERECDTIALHEHVRRGTVDLWQADIVRLGVVEAWPESASLANAYHIPVLLHFYKEYDVPLLVTVPNACGSRSSDWVDELTTHPVRMEAGYGYPNDQPGWGFSFIDNRPSEF